MNLSEGFGGTQWIDVTHKLPLTIRYDFVIETPQHELIGVFSKQCGEWGSGSDGLTWTLSSHSCEINFRTKIFGDWPASVDIHQDQEPLIAGMKYQAELLITETYSELKLNGQPYYSAKLKPGHVMPNGKVGFTSYSGLGSSTVNNITFHEGLQEAVAEGIPVGETSYFATPEGELQFGTPVGMPIGYNMALKIGQTGTKWIDVTHKLPLIIRYDFVIETPQHELIGVFSKKCGEWGSGSDGLTWTLSSHSCGFNFRTKIFGGWPKSTTNHIEAHNMIVGKTYQVELRIESTFARLKLDGLPYYSAEFWPGQFETEGKVGFTSFSGKGSSKISNITFEHEHSYED